MQYILNRKRTALIFILLIIWISLILLAPVLQTANRPAIRRISDFIYLIFKPTCHQLPSRSFYLGPYTMAVCTRCFALYSAGFLLTGFYLFHTQIKMLPAKIYLLLSAPLLIDFILEKINFYDNIWPLRFLTGFLAGFVFFHLILVGISEKNYSRKDR